MKQRNDIIFIFVIAMALTLSSVFPVVQASSCIDVYDLTVQGNVATAKVRNNQDVNETVYYKLFVDGSVVSVSNTVLEAYETRVLTLNYDFNPGEYDVIFRAVADCGSDEDYLIHILSQPYSCTNPYGIEGQGICDYDARQYLICQNGVWVSSECDDINYCNNCNSCGDGYCNCGETSYTCIEDCECEEGYLNEYRCVDSWIQRKYRKWNCETEWINWRYAGVCCDSCNGQQDCDSCIDGGCACYTYCNAGYLDVYRCYGSWLQRVYKNEDCSKTWHDWEYCEFGCSNKRCNPPCGVLITEFDYTDKIFVEQEGSITVVVKNTGGRREVIELEFYLDGIKKDFYAKSVQADETMEKIFRYKTEEGKHRISVIATSRCSRSDAKAAYVTVFSKQTGVIQPIQEPEKVEEIETSVQIFPNNLDISLQGSKVVAIDIETKIPQEFSIEISGISPEWVSYVKEKYIENEDFMYVYITPKDYGSYNFDIKVTAEEEDLTFTSNIKFFVASPEEIKAEVSFFGDLYAKMIVVFTSFWFLLSMILTALAFVLIIGVYNLRYETIEQKMER
jgi:hypothetical protein